jgi:hypothetical protein
MGGSKRRELGCVVAVSMAWATSVPAIADPHLELPGWGPRLRFAPPVTEYKLDSPRLLRDEPAPFRYSLDEQVAYSITHAPSLLKLERAQPAPVELASLQVNLPF